MPLTEEERKVKRNAWERAYYQKIKDSPEYKKKKKEKTRLYKARHPETLRASKHAYYEKNKKSHRAYTKKYREEHLERLKECAAKNYQENKEEHKEKSKARRKKCRDNLTGNDYIRSMLVDDTCLKRSDIPQSLIEAKRLELKMKRFIKEQENEQSKEHDRI